MRLRRVFPLGGTAKSIDLAMIPIDFAMIPIDFAAKQTAFIIKSIDFAMIPIDLATKQTDLAAKTISFVTFSHGLTKPPCRQRQPAHP